MDFVTGLVVGRNEAAAVSQEWAEFADGLEREVADLRTRLHNQKIYREANRADAAAIKAVLASLPADLRQTISAALNQHYVNAFLQHAVNNGLDADYAQTVANNAHSQLQTQLHDQPGR